MNPRQPPAKNRVAALVEDEPRDAFRIFTDRIGSWFKFELPPLLRCDDVYLRFEPGVGGRLVADSSAWALAYYLGRVTAWDDGRRLAWFGRDGATIDVEFTETRDGTLVTVERLVTNEESDLDH